jgi:methyl-accepting chemotaxis protein
MSRIRTTSIGVRLAAAFGALCLACLVVAAVGLSAVGSLQDSSRTLTVDAESMLNVRTVSEGTSANAESVVRHLYVSDGDLAAQDRLAAGIAERRAGIVRALDWLERAHRDETEIFTSLTAARTAFVDATEQAVDRSREETVRADEEREGSRTTYLERVLPARGAMSAELTKLQNALEEDVAQHEQAAQEVAASARRTVIVAGVIALLLGVGLAVVITRSVAGPVRAIVARLESLRDHCISGLNEGLRRMADGDLTHEVEAVTPLLGDTANDELGRVARSVDEIRNSTVASLEAYTDSRRALGDLIGKVTTTASTLSAASQQMATTSEEAGRAVGEIAQAVSDVAQGAERQVRAVEEAKLAAEQVGDATRSSAQSAQETAQAAEQAREVAHEGEQAVTQATEAMRSVRETSGAVTAAMRQLGAKSEQIGGIVATITGIAGQTNLLALNAAIEAARAGEQGRGFAVVAEEVRKLAEESQQAAASIASLVEEIQAETGQAVSVVEEGAQRTEDGAETVEQARDAFERIGASVEDMSSRVDAIAAAVDQIAASSERMQTDMSEVAAVAEQSSASSEEVSASTQETSASAQEIASSAQELARTAEELEQLVGAFRLATA